MNGQETGIQESLERKDIKKFKCKKQKKKYHFARTRRSDASFYIEGFRYFLDNCGSGTCSVGR